MAKSESKSTVKHLTAGGIAGAMEAFLMYPTEFVKTQMQLQTSMLRKAAQTGAGAPQPKFTGIVGCIKYTFKTHGIPGFYRGVSTLIVGSTPKAAVRFGAYNLFSEKLKDDKGKLSTTGTLLAGLGAGITEAIIAVTPMETVKTKFIHDQNKALDARKYRGLVHGVRTIIAEEGIRGVYQGLLPTMLKQGGNQACRFFVFNQLKGVTTKSTGRKDLNAMESMLIGGVAGIISVYVTMPFDVVKTRMQGLEAKNYKSSVDCSVRVLRDEGVFALWKGTVPRLSRVMFSTGLIFTFQEQTLRLINQVWPDEAGSSHGASKPAADKPKAATPTPPASAPKENKESGEKKS
jgi:solute carrier family 25 citrate transporter 1